MLNNFFDDGFYLRPKGKKIVCIGDSLTSVYAATDAGGNLIYESVVSGYGWIHWVSPDKLWTNLVSLQTGLEMINKGIASQTSTQLLARFQTDVIALKPDLCIIEEGANDAFKKVPLATTQANIIAMVNLCKQNNIIPLIMNCIPGWDSYWSCTVPWGMTDQTTYNFNWETDSNYNLPQIRSWEQSYCAANSIQYIDIYSPFLSSPTSQNNALYIYDHVHPNQNGQLLITSAVITALKSLGVI